MLKLVTLTAALALACGCAAAAQTSADSVAAAEAVYADANDAASIVGAIDSGLFSAYRGRDRAAWESQFALLRKQLRTRLSGIPEKRLSPAEARVLGILRAKAKAFSDPSSSDGAHDAHCVDARSQSLQLEPLSAALEACFTEIANRLEFEGQRLDRATALGRLGDLDDPKRREALFRSFLPLWSAINGTNAGGSPYRRLIRLAAQEARGKGSPVDAAARTLGVESRQVGDWLVRILEAWSTSTEGESFEPWDYRYASGSADRALAGKVPLGSMLQIDHRYYRDLGVDLDALGVLYDLEPRADKSSVAYTDFLIHGRYRDGVWQPTIARVLATYRDGSLGALNELVHENGHAAHISAIRNRPAFVDWNDDLFVEAFADVSSWSLYEPAWQRRYLSGEASEQDSLRSLFGGVMLDVAWALFETRMLQDPGLDPQCRVD